MRRSSFAPSQLPKFFRPISKRNLRDDDNFHYQGKADCQKLLNALEECQVAIAAEWENGGDEEDCTEAEDEGDGK